MLCPGCTLGSKERQATVGSTQVSGTVTKGKIVGQPLPPVDPGNDIATIGPPIHLEVAKGELKGEATLRTPVSDDLPKGVTPDMVGYLTKHEPSGLWFWMGGDYDPATRTVVLQTPHFSDWVLGYTDPAKLSADMQDFQFSNVISKALLETMYGKTPKVRCTRNGRMPKGLKDIQTLVDVKINDPDSDLEPQAVKACMGLDEKTGDYNLEIANPHGYPIKLHLPDGVTLKRELTGDEGILQQAYAQAQVELTNDVVLWQQGKVRLVVKPEKVTADTVITGQIDYGSLVFNTALWLTELALSPKSLEEAQGAKKPEQKQEVLDFYVRTIKRYAKYGDCANKTVGNIYRERKIDLKKLVYNTMDSCLSIVAGQVADGVSQLFKISPKDMPRTYAKFWTSKISLIKESMKEGRGILGTSLTSAETLGVGYELKIQPTRDVHIEQALPAPMEGDFRSAAYGDNYAGTGDGRELTSDLATFFDTGLLTPDCTHGLVFSPHWVIGGKAGLGQYTVIDNESHLHEAWFMLIPVKPEYRTEAYKYVAKTKRDCEWDPARPDMGQFSIRNTTTLGQAVVSYDIESPTDSFVRTLSYSNGFVLVGTVGDLREGASSPDNELRDKALDSAFKFAALKADATFVGTTFGKR
jgi:hypothetical protein